MSIFTRPQNIDNFVEVHSAQPLIVWNVQVELDRFQATLQTLKVYYLSMCKDVLPELSSDILKIALQDAAEICDPYVKHTPLTAS